MKNFIIVFVCGISLLPFNAFSMYSERDEYVDTLNKITIGATVGVVAASVGYAFYRLGEWLFEKTDKQILDQARISYKVAEKQSIWLINEHPELLNDAQSTISKHLLKKIASKINAKFNTIHSFLKIMDASMYTLKQNYEILNKRILRLKKINTESDKTYICKKMKTAADSIKQQAKKMHVLKSFLLTHKNYFILYTLVDKLSSMYRDELGMLEHQHTIKKALPVIIMRTYSQSKVTYPYINYVEKLTASLQDLTKAINSCTLYHQSLIEDALFMRNSLETIHSQVIINPHYHSEIEAFEKNRLQEQRIAIERQKANALRAQANALEDQNRLRWVEIYNQERIMNTLSY